MILYTVEPKDSIKTLVEHIREFGRVADYKVNEQISVALVYTNNSKSEKQYSC